MYRLVLGLTCLTVASLAQEVDPSLAKILKEQRFNAGDGRAGSAFATEDGVIFKEETDLDGNRVGQYSYIGDDGQTYTVRYSAGKDGFRILDGAHIPSGGQGAAAFVADPDALPEEPLPARAPAPVQVRAQPAPLPPRQAVPQPEPQFLDYEDVPVDPNRNPFINPHDPTHRDFRFNKNAAAHDPASPLSQQASLVPPCADCAGVNPFINPFDASHRPNLAGHLAGHLAGAAPRRQQVPQVPRPAPRQRPQTVVPPPAPLPPPSAAVPTQRPKLNFFPPGQLKLNRFETGFNFDFES